MTPGRFALATMAAFFAACRSLAGQSPAAPPTTPRAAAFAALLDSLRHALDLPALAAAIVTDDRVLEVQAVGSRRYGGPADVTVDDQFHLGSDTKAMTAVLLGTLVDEGRVAWSTTLAAIFPEDAAAMRAEYRDVTLREVLSHQAGFPRDPAIHPHAGTPQAQRAEVVAWALRQPPAAARGTYGYANLGYIVAGAIAERLTGRAFEDLLRERVFAPLGITSAGFGPMGTVGREDQPLQHTADHQPIEPRPDADNPPIYDPAGRVHMSIGDWARFARWVLDAAADRQTLLRPATAAMLTAPQVPAGDGVSYAMGWLVVDRAWAGGRALTHAGSNTYNFALAWVAPARHFAVLAATNQGPGTNPNPLDPVAARLIRFHLDGR